MNSTDYEVGLKMAGEARAEALALNYDPSFRAGEDCVRGRVADLVAKAAEAARLMGVDPPPEVPWLFAPKAIIEWRAQ